MKLSAQEAYGLRCLLRLAKCRDGESLTIVEISKAEGFSVSNAAKLMRMLRMRGLVESARGSMGGYRLTDPPDHTTVASVIEQLGGQVFNEDFCRHHSGREKICTHDSDCSLRPLWNALQLAMSDVLKTTTLADLLCSEQQMTRYIKSLTGHKRPLLPEVTAPSNPRDGI